MHTERRESAFLILPTICKLLRVCNFFYWSELIREDNTDKVVLRPELSIVNISIDYHTSCCEKYFALDLLKQELNWLHILSICKGT